MQHSISSTLAITATQYVITCTSASDAILLQAQQTTPDPEAPRKAGRPRTKPMRISTKHAVNLLAVTDMLTMHRDAVRAHFAQIEGDPLLRVPQGSWVAVQIDANRYSWLLVDSTNLLTL